MAIIHYELPDDLHRALKIRAAEFGVTLKALILRYLAEGLESDVDAGWVQNPEVPT